MELKTILDPAIIDPAVEGSTKDEVLRAMAVRLRDNGYVDDVERFIRDIYEREAKGPTGMGSGVSIPHGKSPAARRMGIAIGRTTAPVRWESGVSDSGWQETRLVFLFCVRVDADFAENHLTLLAQLAGKLGSEARLARLARCRSAEEIVETLLMEDSEPGETGPGERPMKIVAVTACTAGIAHTYIVAEKIQRAAEELGHQCRVETQGSAGVENALTAGEIAEADVVIFCHDVALHGTERFAGKRIVDIPISTAMKQSRSLIADIGKKRAADTKDC